MGNDPGRNEPCPCGSGRKFKRCCGAASTPAAPPVDPRALEKHLLDIRSLMSGQEFGSIDEANIFLQKTLIEGGGKLPDRKPETKLDRAQDIMYEAWDAKGERRIRLAKEALALDPDCADAYVMLAEEDAESLDEALELFRKGVEAGERALGERVFREEAGHFWGLVETRPYLRARTGLAQCLWQKGKRQEAIEHYRDMIRLNPNDNQGLRYVLLSCLLETNDGACIDELLTQFGDDGTAEWLYGRALYGYRKNGDTADTRKILKEAVEANRHVPKYLLGKKPIPRNLPEYIGFGDESEAASCAAGILDAWRQTPGALDWLKSEAA